ncbi:TetR/AcrR family transcriptional regulator [Nocardia sp. NPDC052278]|uniref:TetR/AcrR family transcriptional regulator n=1 Tax=unclassified Nocardia TaxID=2637762 RepID=UPI0036B3C81D
MTTSESSPSARRMRSDAARNHAKILAAGDRLLSERGLDVTLDDVAAAAEVGVGTVYRRFANKSELIAEITGGYVTRLEEAAAAAERNPDPWSGLAGLLERTCELVAGNRGLAAAMSESADGARTFARFEAAVAPVLENLVDRARADGAVRADLAPADVLASIAMVHSVAAFTGAVRPGNWRRYLALLLDGMRYPAEPAVEPALTMAEIRSARAIAAARDRR